MNNNMFNLINDEKVYLNKVDTQFENKAKEMKSKDNKMFFNPYGYFRTITNREQRAKEKIKNFHFDVV